MRHPALTLPRNDLEYVALRFLSFGVPASRNDESLGAGLLKHELKQGHIAGTFLFAIFILFFFLKKPIRQPLAHVPACFAFFPAPDSVTLALSVCPSWTYTGLCTPIILALRSPVCSLPPSCQSTIHSFPDGGIPPQTRDECPRRRGQGCQHCGRRRIRLRYVRFRAGGYGECISYVGHLLHCPFSSPHFPAAHRSYRLWFRCPITVGAFLRLSFAALPLHIARSLP